MTVDEAVAAFNADVVQVYRPPQALEEERVVWSDLTPAERMAYQPLRAGRMHYGSYLEECRRDKVAALDGR